MPKEAALSDLLVQARITNRLLAAQLRSTLKQNELVELLDGTGATPQDIATILNTTAATISVTLHRLKKRSK